MRETSSMVSTRQIQDGWPDAQMSDRSAPLSHYSKLSPNNSLRASSTDCRWMT